VLGNGGNIYVAGVFYGAATFGAGEANETVLNALSQDIFIAKYSGSGRLVWARRAGGESADGAAGIAVDPYDNVCVTGFFGLFGPTGTATFGSGDVNETVLASPGNSGDVFVAKYDSTGSLVWAKRAGGA